MKKAIIFFKIYWTKILLVLVILAVLTASGFFLRYCIESFGYLENFQRRSIAGQMALLLPMFALVHLVTMPIMLGMQYYFMQGGFAKMGQSKISMAKADVKWDEVIGMEEAKKDAWELIELLKDRSKLKRTGGKIIKGMLMMGPPGCGKTYLAKAVATECGLPIVSASGSDFIGMFIGIGTSRLKSLFKKARTLAEIHGGCLIFIDEIDSFARHRRAETGFGGTMDRNATINQFLTELDGLRKTENNIVVLAATNSNETDLDAAILRPGRLERKINVTRPNLKEREALFNLYLGKVDYNKEEIDLSILARKTVWFSPAEIESMVREAALLSQRNHHKHIEKEDIGEAYERVSFGQKSNVIQPEKDKLWTAYHETGHALLYYLLAGEHDVMKATVIPRSGSLGYVFARPREEQHKHTKDYFLTEIKVCLGSYAVEQKKFGTTSSGVGGGAASDFGQAMKYAHVMVWSLGMGNSGLIGDFSVLSSSSGYSSTSLIAEATKEKLNNDVQQILQQCLKEVRQIVDQNWDAIVCFAEQLYVKEELDYDEIEEIFQRFNIVRPSEFREVPGELVSQKEDHIKRMEIEKKEKEQNLQGPGSGPLRKT